MKPKEKFVPMKPEQKYKLILSVLRPSKRKSSSPMIHGLAALVGANKDKTIHGRTLEARDELRGNVHFLGGILTVLPALKLNRHAQFQHEGEMLVTDAFVFGNRCNASNGSIRKMRKFGEKILRLVEKIEKDAKRLAVD